MLAMQGGSYQTDGDAFGAAFAILVLVYLVVAVVSIVATVVIVRKAGYSGWWVLTSFVPILNVIMFLVFAFSDWPVAKAARGAQYQLPPQYPSPPAHLR